jgi:hypothetical protein
MIGILSKKTNSKKGWIKIVEAFIALLLITGALLVVINRGYVGKSDISPQVYQVQVAILREIQLNSEYRTAILNASSLPVEWSEFEKEGLKDVNDKIESRKPDYLDCIARICELDEVCPFNSIQQINQDIYAQSVAITAEGDVYKPRQLKLFCWSAG